MADERFIIALERRDGTRVPIAAKADPSMAVRVSDTFASMTTGPYVVIAPSGECIHRTDLPMPVDGTADEWIKAVQFQTAAYPYPEDIRWST